MRKLLTALLVLPFLLGANAGARTSGPGEAPAAASAAAPHGMSALAVATPQPPLPAQLTTTFAIAGSAHFNGSGASDWRAPTRSGRAGSDLLHGDDGACSACMRLSLLHELELGFRQALAHAHAGRPATYGTPPPASLT